MKRRAGMLPLLLVFLGLAAGLFCLLKPARERDRTAGRRGGGTGPGGDELVLELFSSEGRPLWRLRLDKASLAAGNLLQAGGVQADYYGTAPPSAVTADELLYDQVSARLSLRRVAVLNPTLELRGGELIWEAKTRSFKLEGGYTLKKEGVAMEGDRLLADESFGRVRALGPVRLEVPLERGGAE